MPQRQLSGERHHLLNDDNWVDSGMSAIERRLAKADFADEIKILSLQSALGGRQQYDLKYT